MRLFASLVALITLASAWPQVNRPGGIQVRPDIAKLAVSYRLFIYDAYVFEGNQSTYGFARFDDEKGTGFGKWAMQRAFTSLWVDRKGKGYASFWYGETGTGVRYFPNGFDNPPAPDPVLSGNDRLMGVATDKAGRIYVVDAGTSQVIRYDDVNGSNRVAFGSAGNGIGQFKNPGGIFIDSKDRIYVADTGNSRIVQFDSMTGEGWRTYDGAAYGGVGAQVLYPASIAVDKAGRIYYLRPEGHKIVRVDDISGKGMVQYGSHSSRDTMLQNPGGIAIDGQDRIYVSSIDGGWVLRMDDMTGAGRVEYWQSGGKSVLKRPTLIAVAPIRVGGGTTIK